MPSSPTSLDELRDEIDGIDDAIHDLLMRRTRIVEDIRDVKGNSGVFMRPGREALITRRLIARHDGAFPVPVLVRMWREMISALTYMQGPFAVAVSAAPDGHGYWDVARDHFGSATPMRVAPSPIAAVREVSSGNATVGVVPWPEGDDSEPWWPLMTSGEARSLHVIARLPFCRPAGARGQFHDALAIARIEPEATGDDRSLIVVEIPSDLSRSRLRDGLDACGLPLGRFCASMPGGRQLVEIDGFVATDDDRLGRFADCIGMDGAVATVIGTYAVPCELPKLD